MSSPELSGHTAEPNVRVVRAVLLPCAALLLFTAVGAARAQTDDVVPLTPPRSASAEAYLAAVAGHGLQTPVLYLPPDAQLDATIAQPAPQRDIPSSETPRILQTIAWIVLVVFLGALMFGIWRSRRNLSELMGPQSREFARRSEAPAEADPEAAIDQDLIARLRNESDPRIGLRLVLQRFLTLAASDNSLVLKRSLTTRELMHRLPGSWAHRGALELLARRTELVVFGGREISREAYEECLELARPFLLRTAAA